MAENLEFPLSSGCPYPNRRCPLAECQARHEAWLDHALAEDMRYEGCPHDGPAIEVFRPWCPHPAGEPGEMS
jgi:hypothetical protein